MAEWGLISPWVDMEKREGRDCQDRVWDQREKLEERGCWMEAR